MASLLDTGKVYTQTRESNWPFFFFSMVTTVNTGTQRRRHLALHPSAFSLHSTRRLTLKDNTAVNGGGKKTRQIERQGMDPQCFGMPFVCRLYLTVRDKISVCQLIPPLTLPHPSIYSYWLCIMDVIIIPVCRHVAPASLLPPSEKAGTAGTQPDYPINLL